jgi:N-acetylmuramoyl-L-alanine amidase
MKIAILDPGHGGIHPQFGYTTAPEKMFRHYGMDLHNGSEFYEGVVNRQIVRLTAEKLSCLGVPCIFTIDSKTWWKDVNLKRRVSFANNIQNSDPSIECMLGSSHSNAFKGKSRGLGVYTSPGETESDRWATVYMNHARRILGKSILYRGDMSDGDIDYEENFYVVKNTIMPSILFEHLFFDNPEDVKLLMKSEILHGFAEAQAAMFYDWANE